LNGEIREFFKENTGMVHGATMIRRCALLEVGGYDEAFRTAQDYDLFARLSSNHKFANLADWLYGWRSHKQSVTGAHNDSQKRNAAIIRKRVQQERALEKRKGGERARNESDPNRVAILIPESSGREGLLSTIESIIAQEYPHWDLRILGVFSDDSPNKEMEPHLTDPRIKVVSQATELGHAASKNRLAEETSANFVMFLEAGDALEKYALRKGVEAFAKNRRCGVVYFDYLNAFQSNRFSGKQRAYQIPMGKGLLNGYGLGPFVMLDRMLFLLTDSFSDELPGAEDFDFYLKLEEITRFAFVSQQIGCVRADNNGALNNIRNKATIEISRTVAMLHAYERRRRSEVPKWFRTKMTFSIPIALCLSIVSGKWTEFHTLSGALKKLYWK
jgi:glycosyltransferase involved in cell wall biosynthesis